MLDLEKGTWVLVADGEKALFLRNELNTRDYDLQVIRQETMDNPATHLQGTDRPGRANSASGARGAAFQETNWHELAEDRFAGDIAEILNKATKNGAFQQIVIVAPPAVLGILRKQFTPATASKVLAEIPKTLTNHPIQKIEELLKSEHEEM